MPDNTPDLAGQLRLLEQYNSLGSIRPFGPGEFVQNSDGGWSNEYSVTVEDPRQPGRFMVVPSLWLIQGKPTLLSEDQAAETAIKSGLSFPSFNDEKSAEAFSTARESKWQQVPVGRSDLQPPLWTKQHNSMEQLYKLQPQQNMLMRGMVGKP
jgi:hypothetical protein